MKSLIFRIEWKGPVRVFHHATNNFKGYFLFSDFRVQVLMLKPFFIYKHLYMFYKSAILTRQKCILPCLYRFYGELFSRHIDMEN